MVWILSGQLFGGEKAKYAEAVIHGDDQHAFAGKMFAVLTRLEVPPPANPPPNIHTMTGNLVLDFCAGAQTLRVRQSSLSPGSRKTMSS